MSRRIAVLVALGVLGTSVGILSTDTGFGQVVDISRRGGVHVRAPFVRVDVGPFGGVSVRAPFAAIDVPGRRYLYEPGPIVMDGPMPDRWSAQTILQKTQELRRMDDETLRRQLRSYAARLQYELRQFDTGDRWQSYLRVPEAVFAGPWENPVESLDALSTTFNRFNKIAADPQYGMIAGLPAFGATQVVMAEMISRSAGSENSTGARSEELPPPDPSQAKGERSLLPRRTD